MWSEVMKGNVWQVNAFYTPYVRIGQEKIWLVSRNLRWWDFNHKSFLRIAIIFFILWKKPFILDFVFRSTHDNSHFVTPRCDCFACFLPPIFSNKRDTKKMRKQTIRYALHSCSIRTQCTCSECRRCERKKPNIGFFLFRFNDAEYRWTPEQKSFYGSLH